MIAQRLNRIERRFQQNTPCFYTSLLHRGESIATVQKQSTLPFLNA